MQVTMCLHRALTPEEVSQLPDYFHTDPATDLAGGPVAILRETVEGWPSTKPCHAPIKHKLDPRDPLLWFPIDCGECGPCQARAGLDAEYDKKREGAPPLLRDLLGARG
jgi:hypothetical protein